MHSYIPLLVLLAGCGTTPSTLNPNVDTGRVDSIVLQPNETLVYDQTGSFPFALSSADGSSNLPDWAADVRIEVTPINDIAAMLGQSADEDANDTPDEDGLRIRYLGVINPGMISIIIGGEDDSAPPPSSGSGSSTHTGWNANWSSKVKTNSSITGSFSEMMTSTSAWTVSYSAGTFSSCTYAYDGVYRPYGWKFAYTWSSGSPSVTVYYSNSATAYRSCP